MILWLFLSAYASAVIAFLLAFAFGHLTSWIAAGSLVAGAALSLGPARKLLAAHPDWRLAAFSRDGSGVLEIVLTVFVGCAALRHFLWLLFPLDHHLATLTAFNYGDLPLHINYSRLMSSGAAFPPVNPSFASETLRYPFGVDLFNALWESIGVPLTSHFFLTGCLATCASLILLRSFAGWWGIGAFFLSGGIAGWSALKGTPVPDLYQNVDWKNLFLAVFVPQRGMLFALPAGLLLLIGVRRHFAAPEGETAARLSRGQALFLGLVWGFLPLFHLHAFVVISLLIAALAIEARGLRGVVDLFQSWLFRAAVVPAVLLILRSTDFFRKAGIAHWKPGWTARPGEFMSFMFVNFGPWLALPVAIAAALVVFRQDFSPARRRALWIEFGVYMGLLALFFNLMLAPWDWDNIKVLIWPYLGLARLAFVVIDRRLGDVTRPVVAFVLLLTGFMGVSQSMRSPAIRGVKIFPVSELANAEGALATVPLSAVFAAAPTHDHPLAYFGRVRVLGYEGHLWSHGIDSAGVSSKQDKLMAGEGEWLSLARELGVTHIYWGPAERAKYGEAQKPWMEVLPNVSRVPGYRVYAVTPSPTEAEKP